MAFSAHPFLYQPGDNGKLITQPFELRIYVRAVCISVHHKLAVSDQLILVPNYRIECHDKGAFDIFFVQMGCATAMFPLVFAITLPDGSAIFVR